MTTKKDEFIIAGIAIKTTNENGQSQTDIPKLWEKFFTENILNQIPNRIDDKVYAVYTDYEGDWTKPYTMILGCAVKNTVELPNNLVSKTIAASTYEVFEIAGKYPDLLLQTWQHMPTVLQDANLNRTYTADFEIYPADFDPSNAKLDVYIAIKNG